MHKGIEGKLPSNSLEFWCYVEPIVKATLRFHGEKDETQIQDVAHRTYEVLCTCLAPGQTVNYSYIAMRSWGIWLKLKYVEKRILYVDLEEFIEIVDQSGDPENETILKEIVARLSPRANAILCLRAKGLNNERIAEKLGTTRHAIEQAFTEIKKQIRGVEGTKKKVRQKESK